MTIKRTRGRPCGHSMGQSDESTKRKSIDTSEKRVDSIDMSLRARLVRAIGEKMAGELLDWIKELEAAEHMNEARP